MRKYYFINKFDTNNIDKQDKQTTIIYRNYSTKSDQTLIIKIKRYCKKKSIKFYLSNNIRLAIKLDLDGAYIPAFNKSLKHLTYSYRKNFKLIGKIEKGKFVKISAKGDFGEKKYLNPSLKPFKKSSSKKYLAARL